MLVTGNSVEKLPTVPTVGSGTGEQMAQTIVTALMDWNIPFDFIVACCFHTKSSNASVHAKAHTILESRAIHEKVSVAYDMPYGCFVSCLHALVHHPVKEVRMFQRFRDY